MRRRKLSILNIDGVEGVGKTTQLNIMANYLKQAGILAKINKIDGSDASVKSAIGETEKFLEENPEGVVLNDGTIARSIVSHLSTGTSHDKIENLYEDDLFKLQVLEHQFGTVNILLVPDSIDSCDERVRKKQELFQENITGIKNRDLQESLIEGFNMFDYSILSRNLKFQTLKVQADESIMAVHNRILELLSSNGFEIKKSLD